MEHAGLWSILPPVIAILLAIYTRQVFISLFAGIWIGWLYLHGGNILTGTFASIEGLVKVYEDGGNTRTIMFCALVGALIVFIQRSGGVEGFINWMQERLDKIERQSEGRARFLVPFFAWLTGVLIFVETSISSLTVGTLFRPMFDKMKISREKLAWIADSSSAPASILIPFNGWGAFIMGLLAAQHFSDPFGMMMSALPWNFYPLIILLVVPLFLWSGRDLGAMKKAEIRVRVEGKVMPDGAQPMVSDALTSVEPVEGIVPKAFNMLVPIAVMVVMMPVILAYTGWESSSPDFPRASLSDQLLYALGHGSGSVAVLTGVLSALLVSAIMYRMQGIFKTKEIIDLAFEGIGGLIPLALLMMLAFAIGAVCRELGTGLFVAEVASGLISPGLLPLIVFLSGCFIAFSTGTSWGTFAIMMPIAIPLAQSLGADIYITIAAVLGGGVFGDHCSPISDTTIISSMSAACDHIDHVRTQMPYALIGGAITAFLYLLIGIL